MKKQMSLAGILTLFAVVIAADTSAQQKGATNDSAASKAKVAAADTAQATTMSDGAATAGNRSEAPVAPLLTIHGRTTNSSGSPSILSGDHGKDRDGTNNVQRATMDMAGSPAGNIELTGEENVDTNSEMGDRQARSQDKSASAQRANEGGTSVKNPDQINNASRRENNDRSDQNLSSKKKMNEQDGGNKASGKNDKKRSKSRKKG